MPVSWLSPFYDCAKMDLQAAYRSVPIHCDDYKATGLQWQFEGENKSTFLFDSRLPFGSNKGPSHFHRLSQAIRRCMLRQSFRGVVAYTDDFFIAAATYEGCRKWMDILIKLLRKLGFSVVVGPSQRRSPSWVSRSTQQAAPCPWARTNSSNSSSSSSTSVHASAPANSDCRV